MSFTHVSSPASGAVCKNYAGTARLTTNTAGNTQWVCKWPTPASAGDVLQAHEAPDAAVDGVVDRGGTCASVPLSGSRRALALAVTF